MTSLPTAEFVRQSVQTRFSAITSAELQVRSERVIERMLAAASWDWNGKQVGLYRSLAREIQLGSLETELRKLGAHLCYPRITDSQKSLMQFVKVEDPTHPESWEAGPYGGTEPNAQYLEIAPDQIDILICPGLAFGRSGERIGRGKGYYDRFLQGDHRSLRLALALDFQLFPSLPQSRWDEPVQQIFTETDQVILKGIR